MSYPSNIRLACKNLKRRNATAYFKIIEGIKKFKLKFVANIKRLFIGEIYRHSMVIPSFCVIKLHYLSNYCGMAVHYLDIVL
jgi:hypothetical protein